MAFSPPSPFSRLFLVAVLLNNGESGLSDITGLFLYRYKGKKKYSINKGKNTAFKTEDDKWYEAAETLDQQPSVLIKDCDAKSCFCLKINC